MAVKYNIYNINSFEYIINCLMIILRISPEISQLYIFYKEQCFIQNLHFWVVEGIIRIQAGNRVSDSFSISALLSILFIFKDYTILYTVQRNGVQSFAILLKVQELNTVWSNVPKISFMTYRLQILLHTFTEPQCENIAVSRIMN